MKIYSFGFRHGPPNPRGYYWILDVRPIFGRNPYHNKKLRPLRGDHPDVIDDILKTPGFEVKYQELKESVAAFKGDVYLGCTGGHHRSVYLANRLGRELDVVVVHLNYGDK